MQVLYSFLSLSLSPLRCISLQSLFTKISFELISSPFCFSFLHIYDAYSCQHSITIDSTIIDNSRVYIHDLAGPLSISTYFKLSYIQICMYGTSGYWWFRCQAPSERLSEKDTMDTSEFRIWHFVFWLTCIKVRLYIRCRTWEYELVMVSRARLLVATQNPQSRWPCRFHPR